jgi:hypothetical protein
VSAAADDPAPPDLNWKLTPGEDAYSGYAGTDANLRWRANDTSAWVGVYTDRVFGTQVRTGADTSVNVGQYVQLQPSIQLASRGFAGGSFNVQLRWESATAVPMARVTAYSSSLTTGFIHNSATGMPT